MHHSKGLNSPSALQSVLKNGTGEVVLKVLISPHVALFLRSCVYRSTTVKPVNTLPSCPGVSAWLTATKHRSTTEPLRVDIGD